VVARQWTLDRPGPAGLSGHAGVGVEEIEMARKVADCRDVPNEVGCTLTIAGEEDEVVAAATAHAVAVHGNADDEELRSMVRSSLRDEVPVA
jgi:hypothetical protein